VRYLDEQHDKLQHLERLAQPPRFVIAPHAQSDAEKARLLRELEGSGFTLLPAGAEVCAAMCHAPPIPTRIALPEPDTRVLFFAIGAKHATGEYPSEWRAGCWKRWDKEVWADDASSVGDESITYPPERVPFWLPMPAEPQLPFWLPMPAEPQL